MAEREGFEPSVPVRIQRFSRPSPSTTQPSLRCLSLNIHPFDGKAKIFCVFFEFFLKKQPHEATLYL